MAKKPKTKIMGMSDEELMRVSPALALSKALLGSTPIEKNLAKQLADGGVLLDRDDALREMPALAAFMREHTVNGQLQPLQPKDINGILVALNKDGATYEWDGPDAAKILRVFKDGQELGNFTFYATKPKRSALLVDEFLHNEVPKMDLPKDELRTVYAMREHLREAKKFVLDEKAALYAAEFIRDHPEAIAYDQQFAIPPFPRMYIELPYPNFFQTLGGTNVHDPVMGDTEVGYFIDGPSVYVLTRVRGEKHDRDIKALGAMGMVMPLRYRLNKPFTVKEEQEWCDRMKVSRLGLDMLFWGSSLPMILKGRSIGKEAFTNAHELMDELLLAEEGDKVFVPEIGRALRANHSFELWFAKDIQDSLGGLLKSAAGDLRNIIALILFLNRTNDVRFDEQMPPKQGWVGPKPAMFLKHNVVRIKLDPKNKLIKTYGGSGSWKRMHECRGHFCHDKVARANDHHLIPQPPEPMGHVPQWTEYGVNQWRCLVCGGKRWHRRAHTRGHREKGQVVTHYQVVK